MKRAILGILLAVITVATLAPFAGAQDVNDFVIQSFEADYYLDKDAEGRSTLKTVEKITAVFPQADQNHGIERVLPTKYDGHSTSLHIQSVVNGAGDPLNYSTRTSGGDIVLRIGDADAYVHGPQEYNITYVQRDIAKFFADKNDDEFYWDVNGTGWSQEVKQIIARVHASSALEPSLTGQASCYVGTEGSTRRCEVSKEVGSGSLILTARANNLMPHETQTIAVGFMPHTFTPYQQTWKERLFSAWLIATAIGLVVAVGGIIWMIMRRRKVMNRASKGTIIAEYLPPQDASVLMSAQVVKSLTSDVTAQLLDLAVRHYIKIYETKEKSLFRAAEYELELIKDPPDLRPEEIGLLQEVFGVVQIKQGDRISMKRLQNNPSVKSEIEKLKKQLLTDAREKYGLFEYATPEARTFKRIGIWVLVMSVVTLSIPLAITAIVAFAFAHTLWPLTEKGAKLRDYLAGLKLYISVAEEDRIKMLQSPEGAEKVGMIVDGSNPKKLIKLYERVLPYAVLFGIEKEWVKRLGVYYETAGTQPDWYSGNAAFNAVIFSSALSSFNSQVSSTYSSTGGADGGGSAGGGGGGGGGGGW